MNRVSRRGLLALAGSVLGGRLVGQAEAKAEPIDLWAHMVPADGVHAPTFEDYFRGRGDARPPAGSRYEVRISSGQSSFTSVAKVDGNGVHRPAMEPGLRYCQHCNTQMLPRFARQGDGHVAVRFGDRRMATVWRDGVQALDVYEVFAGEDGWAITDVRDGGQFAWCFSCGKRPIFMLVEGTFAVVWTKQAQAVGWVEHRQTIAGVPWSTSDPDLDEHVRRIEETRRVMVPGVD